MSKPPDQSRSNSRRRAVRRGRWAETLSALYLRLTGHRILARNYKTPMGEIDLIARRKNILSFVEVKARPTLGQAAEAITPRQQIRIQRAAELFLQQNPALHVCDIRFDVCLVTGALRLHLLRDAWRP